MTAKFKYFLGTHTLSDGLYLTPKRTKANRIRGGIVRRLFLWLTPKCTEALKITTTSGRAL